MTKHFVTALLLIVALNGCSDHDVGKTSGASPTQTNMPVTVAPDETKIGKDYAFNGAGVLRLTFRKTWADAPKRIKEGNELVNSIDFVPLNGGDFQVHVEVRNLGEGVANAFDIRASLMKAGEAELADCVEKSLDIHEFKGTGVSGGYYTVTDKNLVNAQPKPGEFRYLTQGYAKLAGTLLRFRVVSNQVPGQEINDAVEMIKTARIGRK